MTDVLLMRYSTGVMAIVDLGMSLEPRPYTEVLWVKPHNLGQLSRRAPVVVV